jgi:hypothetical protein
MVDSLPSTPTMVSAVNQRSCLVFYSLASSIANQLLRRLTHTLTPTTLPLRRQQLLPLPPIVAIPLGVVLVPAVLLAALATVALPTEVQGVLLRPLSAHLMHLLSVSKLTAGLNFLIKIPRPLTQAACLVSLA